MLALRNRVGSATRSALKIACAFFIVAAAAPARAQTPVVFGDTINDPGVYFLAGNQSGGGNGILIASDDVTLLLTRFTLRGDGTGYGIHAEGRDNVTIWGGRITNFTRGIELINGRDCTIKDTRVDHCRSAGILLHRDTRLYMSRVRSEYNGANGIDVVSNEESRFVSVLANNNGGDGIHSDAFGPIGTRNSKFRKCWLAYNDGNGLQMLNAGLNDIVENQLVANLGAGILLGGFTPPPPPLLGADGSDENVIERNWCVFNVRAGIALEDGSDFNDLSYNTALANQHADLVDDNPVPPCANTWFINTFFVRDGDGADCIF